MAWVETDRDAPPSRQTKLLLGITTSSLEDYSTHILAYETVYNEEHHSLDGVEEAEEPLNHLRCNVVTNHKEAKGPRDPQDGKEDKGGVKKSTAV